MVLIACRVSIPSHLGSSFGLGQRKIYLAGVGVSIPSHLGSSFGRGSYRWNDCHGVVSIPSHLGSSFGQLDLNLTDADVCLNTLSFGQ